MPIVLGVDGDLTTLDAVRSFLQKPTPDTNQDEIISSLITRASEAIMHYCEREFAPTTPSEARTFEYDGRCLFLDLAPFDLRAVASVKDVTDPNNTVTLETSKYRLWPHPARDGAYQALRLYD